jgi:Phage integrase family
MGRPATGHLSENRSKSTGRITSWGLRFSYAGRRQHLTLPASTREQAERERAVVMEEVRSGVWASQRRRPPGRSSQTIPTFERFAGEWVVRQKDEGGRRQMGLSTAGQADLQWRLEHLLAYFAAVPLDEITVSEVDDQAKTDAGVRIVHLLPILRRVLAGYRDRLEPSPNRRVFATSSGGTIGATNVRIRMLARAVERANAKLSAKGQRLPDGLTPHSLRRTFASLLFALGEPPTYVMSQMGHTTPGLTLALYAREMNRRDGERHRLRALVTDEPQQPAATAPSTATATGSLRIIPVHGTVLTARVADREASRQR